MMTRPTFSAWRCIMASIIASCFLLLQQQHSVVEGFGITAAPLGRARAWRSSPTDTTTTALSATTTKTLYDRIGGKPAVDATVDEMYVRILGDPALAPFFADTDMVQQKQHQAMFLTIAFGGAKTDMDIGAYISDKHRKSFSAGLNETHFDAVAGHVVDSLKSLTVPDDLIDEVVGVVMPLRPIFETKK